MWWIEVIWRNLWRGTVETTTLKNMIANHQDMQTHEQVYVYTTLKNMIANHPFLFYKNQ